MTLPKEANALIHQDLDKKSIKTMEGATFQIQPRIGEQPIKQFYQNYKGIKRSVEREDHLKLPQAAYLYQCEKQRLMPMTIGLVNYKGKEDEINASRYCMGNNYAAAYGKGLLMSNVKKVDISNNNLN